jgi:branched-chain amino acid transport system substrate-binding protein
MGDGTTMKMMNRGALGAFTLVLAVGIVLPSGCATDGAVEDTDQESKEPYVVGAVLSLTGAQSGLGGPEKNAIEMEVARINEAGGINGHPLEVIIEDDASDVDQAIARTTKLVEQDGVLAIIGSTGTGQAMAMRDVINGAQVPQVALGSGSIITAEFDPLVFQTPWTADLIVPLALQHLKDEGLTKIGLITEDTGFGKDGRALVTAIAADFGLSVVSDQVFKPADTDMSGQLTVIKGADADVVLMWSSVAASSIVPKNMAQLNLGIPLVCSHGIAKQEFIDGAGAAGEGVIAFAGKVLAPETYGVGTPSYDSATGFVERYTEAYGVAPDHFAGHAYDGLYLVVEALERLDEGFTPMDLRDEIEKTSGFAGIGGVFTFSATDHNGMSADDIVMYRIEDGRWVLAK